MQLSRIEIKNFRLLRNVKLQVDPQTTLIVGRNNTAKTSALNLILHVLKDKPLSFDDYPVAIRSHVSKYIYDFFTKDLDFESFIKKVPTPELTFFVDYSTAQDEDNLGALSPFIIDVDYDTTTAIIKAKYVFSLGELVFQDFLNEHISSENTSTKLDFKSLRLAIENNFSNFFQLQILAIDPNNKDNFHIKSHAELVSLFPFYPIFAERQLDESSDGKQKTLAPIITNFFNKKINHVDQKIQEQIKNLVDAVNNANLEIQKQTDSILSTIIQQTRGFGYPSAEELNLTVKTKLNIENQIKNNSELMYSYQSSNETLPESYNGLGYKNLIKIQFELASFAESIRDCTNSCIPLLFIEEPEAHMHPQLQQSFISYLETFLGKISSTKIQTFITSHSAHIANTVDFSKIRYTQKGLRHVVFKDLNKFSTKEPSNLDFIKKYLTLTKCDLFFTDKAILVEGAAERLLLPDMIEKCQAEEPFKSQSFPLTSQYYSIIEVGGAYAHKFIPLMTFLGVPTLILTDLDPAKQEKKLDKNGSERTITKGCHFSEATTTTNETIKYWLRKIEKLPEKSSILKETIIGLSSDEKSMKKLHIEFQTEENGFTAPSLEHAIINVNREIYGLEGDIVEDDLTPSEKCKTNFALKLINEHATYNIPEYIKNGILWLSKIKVLS